MKQFKLPDVGEGLTEAEIVSWKVKPGDTVKVNEIIVEIETAKSLVELPCPFAGTVAELLVPEGTTVDVGTPIITVDDGTGAAAGAAPVAPPRDDMAPVIDTPKDDEAVEPGLIGGPAPGGRTSVLVGYGPRTTSAVRRPRKGARAPNPFPRIALPIGIISAIRQDSIIDYVLRFFAILTLAAPNFWVATMLLLYVVKWKVWDIPLTDPVLLWDDPASSFKLFVIPAVVGGLATGAGIMRLLRSQML